MDRITSVVYPTAESVSYEYNNLGQLTGVPGFVAEEPEYNDLGLIENISAANSVTMALEYDKNARLTGLNYTDQNLEEIRTYTLIYDNANNIIQKNLSSYNYDELNRLVFADLNGRFAVDNIDEEYIAGLKEEDFIGEGALVFDLSEEDIVQLDYSASSIGVDLGQSYYVSRLEIIPDKESHRVHADSVEVFVSDLNTQGEYKEVESFAFIQREDGVIELKFKQAEKTRYVKVHCYFDDWDKEENPIDNSTVQNSAAKILKVYYMVEWRQEAYTYDAIGNRLFETITQGETTSKQYTYYENTQGRNSHRLKSDSVYNYEYDNNGNLIRKTEITTGAYWEYEFNLLNRLVAVKRSEDGSANTVLIATYLYDEAGYRVKKESSEKGTTCYVFSVNGVVLYEEKDSGEYSEYVYVFNKHFARVDGNLDGDGSERKKYFYHTDHLGSTVAITNEAGEVVWKNDFTPFGSETGEIGLEEHGAKFTGKDLDEAIGLYYFNARWYDPDIGRFISVDPIKDGINWYVYCRNNPLIYVDESGLQHEPKTSVHTAVIIKGFIYGSYITSSSPGVVEKGRILMHKSLLMKKPTWEFIFPSEELGIYAAAFTGYSEDIFGGLRLGIERKGTHFWKERLQNTERFAPGALKHIFEGEVKFTNPKNPNATPKPYVSGKHYDAIESKDNLDEIETMNETPEDVHGVYEAKVYSKKYLIEKKVVSSFFPKGWCPQKVVDVINEAYDIAMVQGPDKPSDPYKYTVTTKSGISVVIITHKKYPDKIKTAYPVYEPPVISENKEGVED